MKYSPDTTTKTWSLVACLFLTVASASLTRAQDRHAAPAESSGAAPLLTLDEAVSLALRDNRVVKNAALEAQKAEDRVGIARSKRLPQFQVDALAGSLVRPFDFSFPAGSFGTYPDIGPIPSTDARITTKARLTTFVSAGVDQPLSQLHKIRIGIRVAELERDMTGEALRAERQKIATKVRKAYFDLVAGQVAADAAREAVKTLTEVQRVTARHLAQQAVLPADALEGDARLDKGRHELSAAENRLVSQREILNDLLGRDLATAFRVEPLAAEDASDLPLETARQRAAENRPEIRQAQMAQDLAQNARRLAKADYIPDISLSARYQGFYNFEVLPRHVTTVGIFVTWQPFDWKRRSRTVAEKTKAVEQAKNDVQQARSGVAIDVGVAHRKWTDAALLVRAARASYRAALERLRVTADRYREEAALLKDLLQAETGSSEAQFQYQQALSSYWGAAADLRRAIGDE